MHLASVSNESRNSSAFTKFLVHSEVTLNTSSLCVPPSLPNVTQNGITHDQILSGEASADPMVDLYSIPLYLRPDHLSAVVSPACKIPWAKARCVYRPIRGLLRHREVWVLY